MPKQHKPRLTERVLKGLVEAVNFRQAGDTDDLTDEEANELTAASDWLTEMIRWREAQREQRKES